MLPAGGANSVPVQQQRRPFKVCPLCGPKLSIFFMLISAWGILFLGILGVFFYLKSATLFEDIGLEHHDYKTSDLFKAAVDTKYQSCAVNCWIAAALYAVTLVASFWQNKWNPSSVI